MHHLHKVGWMEKLLRWSESEQGGDAVTDKGRTRRNRDDDGFKIPRPTLMIGSYAEPIRPNNPPSGPSQAEIENQPLVDAAMAVRDPWANDEPPPLYSNRAIGK